MIHVSSSAARAVQVMLAAPALRSVRDGQTGIQINAPRPVHHVSIVGNSVRDVAAGTTFGGSVFQQTHVCALNRIAANVTAPLVGLSLPECAIVTGGAASREEKVWKSHLLEVGLPLEMAGVYSLSHSCMLMPVG